MVRKVVFILVGAWVSPIAKGHHSSSGSRLARGLAIWVVDLAPVVVVLA